MSSDEVREPRARNLILFCLCLGIGAVFVAGSGIRSRANNREEITRWSAARAVPTVQIVRPQMAPATRELVLPGDIQAFNTAAIFARASGYVRAWHKDIGDKVKKGDVLAEIDTPDLDQQYAQAKADLANAEVAAKLATTTAKRYHALVGQSIVSQQTDDEHMSDASAKQAALDSSRANLARLEALVAFKVLTAPFDGVVTARSIDVGALVNGAGPNGVALYQIADLHVARVYVRVPQVYVPELEPGIEASLDMPQYPGHLFKATIVGTSNAIAQESRTALVQLQAENVDGKLWPGTFTEVRFHLRSKGNVVQVPATALIFGEHGLQVATVDQDDKILMKSVKIGKDIGSSVEVAVGLSLTDRVVDSPLETLRSGLKVDVVASNPPNPA